MISAPSRARSPSRPDGRVRGVDAARAVAVVGMVMVHFGPVREAEGWPEGLYAVSHGRASILFILLAGVGVSLLSRDRSPGRRRSVWLRLGFRTLVLLPVGLGLQAMDHGVLVILQYYAVYFLVAAAVFALPSAALFGGAGVVLVGGPLVYLAAWRRWPEWFDVVEPAWGDPPVEIARALLLSGAYPLVTWTAPLMLGLWLGRRDLRSTATRWRLVAGGSVAAAGAWAASRAATTWSPIPAEDPSWWQLAVDDPHSQMPLWIAGACGTAVAVLGLCLLAADRGPRTTWPLVATGQMALTVYVGHLFVLAYRTEWLRADEVGDAVTSVARFTVVTALACTAWRWWLPRGPLEAVLRAPWSVPRWWRTRLGSRAGGG